MNRQILFSTLLFVGMLSLIMGGVSLAQEGGVSSNGVLGPNVVPNTAFHYQGRLMLNGHPVDDVCDFQFSLWDAAVRGQIVGTPLMVKEVEVKEGIFSVSLDFGTEPFDGQRLWLQTEVNCGDGWGKLSPRQELMPVPYAITAFSLNGFTEDDFWKLAGNKDTTPGDDFLGTIDDRALELHVDGRRIIRLEPANDIGNIIGGGSANKLTEGVYGAVIAGGGDDEALGNENSVYDHYGVVGGGSGNWVGNYNEDLSDARMASVLGGYQNSAQATYAVAVGGSSNTARGSSSFIGGGSGNSTRGSHSGICVGTDNGAEGDYAFVSAGMGNMAVGVYSFIGGGENQLALGDHAVIGGGEKNRAEGVYATVGGGEEQLALGAYAVISGGERNKAEGMYATVSGGWHNQALAEFATIGGGGTIDPITEPDESANRVYDAYGVIAGGGANRAGLDDDDQFSQKFAAVGGGQNNDATAEYATVGGGMMNSARKEGAAVGGGAWNSASGRYASVPGGEHNKAQGDYSLAAGLRAHANHDGAFVWADASLGDFSSTKGNQFRVRANGGVEFEVGKESLRVTADSTLYLSPHDMVVRGCNGVTLRPLDNGGVRIQPSPDGRTKYVSLPISTFGTLFGAQLYIQGLRVCYRTNSSAVAYITASAVGKNNGGASAVFYINNSVDRHKTSYACYNVGASTPLKPIDNSSWVQFNIRPGQTGDYIDIFTVALTLTEYP